jgi:hypothetical protein
MAVTFNMVDYFLKKMSVTVINYPAYYPNITCMFAATIQSMNLCDVFMNKSLKQGTFRDVFEGMLKTKPFDEFESLI